MNYINFKSVTMCIKNQFLFFTKFVFKRKDDVFELLDLVG